MKILLIGFGSRGDVQPLIALGHGLQAANYEVILAAGENYREWVESENISFEPIGVDVEAFIKSDVGTEWLTQSSKNPLLEARRMKKAFDGFAEQVAADVWRIAQLGDVLVSGFMGFATVDRVAAKLDKPHIHALLQPMAPSPYAAATINPFIPNMNIFLNRWAGYITQHFVWNIFADATNIMLHQLDLPPMSRGEFIRMWNGLPTIYGISPTVIPHEAFPQPQHHVTGYWFYDKPSDWQPSDELCAFLEAGEKPVYIGFGSMASNDPQATTKIMIDALNQSRQRGVIHTGWAGLHAEDLPDNIFLLDYAPHDWLFPQMAGVIHHGGAGTTATTLRAGVPMTIVPHISEQKYWGRVMHNLGVATPYINRHNLSTKRLANAITSLVSDTKMQQRAAEIHHRIQLEDGVARAVEVFDSILR